MSNQALFHLGYPKCASTFLQVKIFPLVHSARYVGLQIHKNITGTAKSLNADSSPQKQMEEHKPLIDFLSGISQVSPYEKRALLQSFSTLRSKSKLIISDENFLDFRYNDSCLGERIANLKTVFAEGDNIIIFSKPLIEILVSMYRDHPIIYKDKEKICTFEEFVSSKDILRQPLLLSQQKVIKELRNSFGSDQVVVFGVEDIANGAFEKHLNRIFYTKISTNYGPERINVGANSLMFDYRILKQKLKFLRNIIPRNLIEVVDTYLVNTLRNVKYSEKKIIHYDPTQIVNILTSRCDMSSHEILKGLTFHNNNTSK